MCRKKASWYFEIIPVLRELFLVCPALLVGEGFRFRRLLLRLEFGLAR